MNTNNEEYFQKSLAGNYQKTKAEFEFAVKNANKLINDFDINIQIFEKVLDLGCGPGAFSKAYNDNGFKVTAIDYCDAFIESAKNNLCESKIEIIKDDIRMLSSIQNRKYHIINCTGDTILYFETKNEIFELIKTSYKILENNGLLIFEFRDFSEKVAVEDRLIIRQNEEQIKIINTQYENEYVFTIDCVLNENGIEKAISRKLIISEKEIIESLKENKFIVIKVINQNNKAIILAKKSDF